MIKTKYFSVLMLTVAVLFSGVIEPVQASVEFDNISIVEVVSNDNLETDLQNEITFFDGQNQAYGHTGYSGLQYTAMEIHSIHHELFKGDIDYQIIILQAPENEDYGHAGYIPYSPRSNLGNLDYS